MQIVIETESLLDPGILKLNIRQDIDIKITALQARRIVKHWLFNEVGMLLDADEPTLILAKQPVWRVPVFFSTPNQGRVGNVGDVDVNIQTGKIENLSERQAAIEQCTKKLASKLPPFRPFDVPSEFIPPNVPRAPILNVDKG